MPRFFIDAPSESSPEYIVIVGDDCRHISRSLRMRVGDPLLLCDRNGLEYESVISEMTSDSVRVRILSSSSSRSEPPYSVTLYQATVKPDRFELAVQKCTEEGVSVISVFESEFCSVRSDSYSESRMNRAAKIAHEAAKQSGRGMIPEIRGVLSFKDAVAEAAKAALPLFFYEGEDAAPLPEVLPEALPYGAEISVMIGSEGGFSRAEAEFARECGMKTAGLGRRILRTETAGAHVLAVLSYLYELKRR